MRSILLALAAFLGVELIVAFAAWFLPAAPGEWPIDTFFKGANWAIQADRVVFGTGQLARTEQPTIFIIGASGSQEAYRPTDWEKLLPGYSVHNLSIGGSNITQLDEVLDHIIKSTPASVLSQSILVVPVIYALFVDDETRWSKAITLEEQEANLPGVTDLERASRFCAAWCSVDSVVFRYGPPWLISLLKTDHRLLERLRETVLDQSREHFLKNSFDQLFVPTSVTGSSANKGGSAKDGPDLAIGQKRRDEVRWLENYMGGKSALQREQFDKLKALIAKAGSVGMRVYLVGMPLPSWHRSETQYDAQARQALQTLVAKSAQPLLHFVELDGTVPDEDFRDLAHPTPEAASRWTSMLIERMQLPGQSLKSEKSR